MNMDHKLKQLYEEFLNPDVLRPRLISASIYIASFESLKEAIIDIPKYFFCSGVDESGPIIDSKYQLEVLNLNSSPLHASLQWLKKMAVICQNDIESFNRIKKCRNDIAHRLFTTLWQEGLPPNFEQYFNDLIDFLRKIELWWIQEIEIPTNPDLDGAKVDADDIIPGRLIGIQLLCEIALGDDQTSRSYIKEFQKRATTS